MQESYAALDGVQVLKVLKDPQDYWERMSMT